MACDRLICMSFDHLMYWVRDAIMFWLWDAYMTLELRFHQIFMKTGYAGGGGRGRVRFKQLTWYSKEHSMISLAATEMSTYMCSCVYITFDHFIACTIFILFWLAYRLYQSVINSMHDRIAQVTHFNLQATIANISKSNIYMHSSLMIHWISSYSPWFSLQVLYLS